LNSRSDVILPHKKFTLADFGGGINTDIHPRCYAPGEHTLADFGGGINTDIHPRCYAPVEQAQGPPKYARDCSYF